MGQSVHSLHFQGHLGATLFLAYSALILALLLIYLEYFKPAFLRDWAQGSLEYAGQPGPQGNFQWLVRRLR